MNGRQKRSLGLFLIALLAFLEVEAGDFCNPPAIPTPQITFKNVSTPQLTWINALQACHDPFCYLHYHTEGAPEMGTHVINSGVTLSTASIGTTTTSS